MDLKVPKIKAPGALVEKTPLPQAAKAVPGPDRRIRRAGKGVVPRQDLPKGQLRDPLQGAEKGRRICGRVEGIQAAPVEEISGIEPPTGFLIVAAVPRGVPRRVEHLDLPPAKIDDIPVP